MRPFSKPGLGAVTAATMATATFAIIVASVLAAQLIEEFDSPVPRSAPWFLPTVSWERWPRRCSGGSPIDSARFERWWVPCSSAR